MNTSEQLGIGFEIKDLKTAVNAFKTLRNEARATGKALEGSLRGVLSARQKVQENLNVPKILSQASVSTNPPNAASASASRNRLNIVIHIKGLPQGGGQGTGDISTPGGRRARGSSRQLPALVKPEKVKTPKSKMPWLPSGPRQNLQKLYNAMAYSVSIGNDAAFEDAHEQYLRLLKKVNPVQKAPKNKWWEIVTTSRFGAHGASPLVGKVLDAMGGRNTPVAKGLIGLTILGTAAVELGKTFLKLTQQGNEFAMSQIKLQASTGGSAKENALLRGIGIASGLSTDDISGLTRGLQQSVSSPGMGMLYGLKAGVFNLPGALGSQDWAKNEIKVAAYLRRLYAKDKSKNHDETFRQARALGQDALIPALSLPEKDWQRAMKAGLSTQQTPDRMIQALKYEEAKGELAASFGNLAASITGQDGVINAMHKLTDIVNRLANPGSAIRQAVTDTLDPRKPLGILPDVAKALVKPDKAFKAPKKPGFGVQPDGRFGFGNGDFSISFSTASEKARKAYERSLASHHSKADASTTHLLTSQKNTDALNTLNETLRGLRSMQWPGSYGTMHRSGAYPSQLDNGWVLHKYNSQRSLLLGTF